MYLTKSRRPEISTAVSFGATNNSHTPLQYHYKELLYMVEFLRTTPDDGLIIRASHDEKIQFYCQVDARYLLHKDSKGLTGYNIGLTSGGYFYIRNSKQAFVSTSSTQYTGEGSAISHLYVLRVAGETSSTSRHFRRQFCSCHSHYGGECI